MGNLRNKKECVLEKGTTEVCCTQIPSQNSADISPLSQSFSLKILGPSIEPSLHGVSIFGRCFAQVSTVDESIMKRIAVMFLVTEQLTRL